MKKKGNDRNDTFMKRKNHNFNKKSAGSVLKGIAVMSVLALGMTGCGRMKNSSDAYVDDYDYGTEVSGDYGYSTDSNASAAAAEGIAEAYEDYEGAYDEASMTYENGSASGLQTIQEENQGAKLIRTVYISLDTEKFDDAITLVEEKTNQAGGYIQSSDLYDYSSGRTQDIVVRVPYEKVDEFLEGIDTCGTIIQKSDYTEDITLQYSDTETHIENLETQHERLLELLEQAESLEDIITLNERLTTIETELDSYKKQIRNYDNLVSYSTITINIREREYVTGTEDKTIGGRITSGLSETMYNIKTFFANLLVWFVVSLPVLLIVAVLVLILVLIIRAIIKKHKKKKAMKQQTGNSQTGNEQTAGAGEEAAEHEE